MGMILKVSILIACFLTCLQCGNPESIKYYMWGDVRDGSDSTMVTDTIVTIIHLSSEYLKPWGRPEWDTIMKTGEGRYGKRFYAWEEDKSGKQMLDESSFHFKVSAKGFAAKETTFTGDELKDWEVDEIKQNYEIELPALFLEPLENDN